MTGRLRTKRVTWLAVAAALGLLTVAVFAQAAPPDDLERVKDIRAGEPGSEPHTFTPLGNRLFFIAHNGANNFEPWVSDGTEAGTFIIKNVNGAGPGAVGEMAAVGDTVFFVGDDGTSGPELWKTDGSFGNAERVEDLNPAGGSGPLELTNVAGKLFFAADDGSLGYELWRGVDTIPPDTTIDSGPSGVTTDSTPIFEFSSNEDPETSFECSIDGGAFNPCSSPRQIGPLADGPHAFSVRALDLEPNVDPTPAARNFTVQTPPPPDGTAPDRVEASVFARRAQRVRRRGPVRIRLRVAAREQVRVRATGVVLMRSARRSRGGASGLRRYRLRPVGARVPTGERRTLVLRPRSGRASRRIRGELRRGHAIARIRVQLSDLAGNSDRVRRSVRLRPPRSRSKGR
ncbi:MAG TPA: hypothetical protein VFZ41_01835 [Solirubrobacterales bacterium]